MLAHGIQSRFQQIHITDTGDFHRVLKGQKHAFSSSLFRRHFQQVFAFIGDCSGSDLITVPACQHMRQGAFARPVRSHNGMDLTGFDVQADAFQDGFVFYADVEVFDF